MLCFLLVYPVWSYKCCVFSWFILCGAISVVFSPGLSVWSYKCCVFSWFILCGAISVVFSPGLSCVEL